MEKIKKKKLKIFYNELAGGGGKSSDFDNIFNSCLNIFPFSHNEVGRQSREMSIQNLKKNEKPEQLWAFVNIYIERPDLKVTITEQNKLILYLIFAESIVNSHDIDEIKFSKKNPEMFKNDKSRKKYIYSLFHFTIPINNMYNTLWGVTGSGKDELDAAQRRVVDSLARRLEEMTAAGRAAGEIAAVRREYAEAQEVKEAIMNVNKAVYEDNEFCKWNIFEKKMQERIIDMLIYCDPVYNEYNELQKDQANEDKKKTFLENLGIGGESTIGARVRFEGGDDDNQWWQGKQTVPRGGVGVITSVLHDGNFIINGNLSDPKSIGDIYWMEMNGTNPLWVSNGQPQSWKKFQDDFFNALKDEKPDARETIFQYWHSWMNHLILNTTKTSDELNYLTYTDLIWEENIAKMIDLTTRQNLLTHGRPSGVYKIAFDPGSASRKWEILLNDKIEYVITLIVEKNTGNITAHIRECNAHLINREKLGIPEAIGLDDSGFIVV